MEFMHFLISKGYQPHRKTIKNNQGVYIKTNQLTFSSLIDGALDIRLLKNKHEIIIGLHDVGYPATLIHPIRYKLRLHRRADWDKWIFEQKHEELLKLILKRK